jgi:uroporphyrinogen decarboxylase
LDIFAPGGGFVFNTVHNILPDVPPANILAMYDTVHADRSARSPATEVAS